LGNTLHQYARRLGQDYNKHKTGKVDPKKQRRRDDSRERGMSCGREIFECADAKNGSVVTTGFERVSGTWTEKYRENKKIRKAT
jgi:hypothetical protein